MAVIKTACHHGQHRRMLMAADGPTPQAKGMYGMGNHDAVRPPADQHFRGGNAKYLRVTHADRVALCILSRVIVENGTALTFHRMPQQARLFERSSL